MKISALALHPIENNGKQRFAEKYCYYGNGEKYVHMPQGSSLSRLLFHKVFHDGKLGEHGVAQTVGH